MGVTTRARTPRPRRACACCCRQSRANCGEQVAARSACAAAWRSCGTAAGKVTRCWRAMRGAPASAARRSRAQRVGRGGAHHSCEAQRRERASACVQREGLRARGSTCGLLRASPARKAASRCLTARSRGAHAAQRAAAAAAWRDAAPEARESGPALCAGGLRRAPACSSAMPVTVLRPRAAMAVEAKACASRRPRGGAGPPQSRPSPGLAHRHFQWRNPRRPLVSARKWPDSKPGPLLAAGVPPRGPGTRHGRWAGLIQGLAASMAQPRVRVRRGAQNTSTFRAGVARPLNVVRLRVAPVRWHTAGIPAGPVGGTTPCRRRTARPSAPRSGAGRRHTLCRAWTAAQTCIGARARARASHDGGRRRSDNYTARGGAASPMPAA